MFLDFTKVEKIFLVTGKTDLRKGIDGLARIIQQDYALDVYEDALFLFCGNRCDCIRRSLGATSSGVNEPPESEKTEPLESDIESHLNDFSNQ